MPFQLQSVVTAVSPSVVLPGRPVTPASNAMAFVTVTVIFLVFSNAGGVAISSHGAPPAIGLGLIGLLALPVLSNLIGGKPLVMPPSLRWLLLFFAIQVVSTTFSAFQSEAAAQLAQFFVEGVVLFFLITNVIRSQEALRRAMWAVVLAGAALGFITVVQWATGSFVRPFGGFALVPSNYLSGFAKSPRAAGPVGDPNYYAQILLPAVPMAVHLMRSADSHGRRILAAGALAGCLSGVVLTGSRGAGLGLVVLVVVAALLRVIRPRGLVLALVAMAVVLAAVPAYRERVATVTSLASATDGGSAEAVDESIRSRATEMQAAAYVFVDHPVVGAGPGAFPLFYQEYARRIGRDVHEEVKSGARRGQLPKREAHNMFLGIAAEAGATGLLAFTGVLGVTIGGLAKARRRSARSQPELASLAGTLLLAIVAYVTAGLFLSLAFERYYWMLLALGAAATQLLRQEVGESARDGGQGGTDGKRPAGGVGSDLSRRPSMVYASPGRLRASAGLTAASARPATVPPPRGRAPLESSNLLPLISRWWRVALCVAILSGLAATAVAAQLPPTYESRVQLLTGPTNTNFQTLRAAGELARTYAELAVTQPLLQGAADEVGIKGGTDRLRKTVKVSASTVSRLVTISARDEDPLLAARTATAVADQLLALREADGVQVSALIDELLRRREVAELPVAARDSVRIAAEGVLGPPEAGRLRVVDPAGGRSQKVGPKIKLIVVLGIIAGLLSLAGFVALGHLFRARVDTEERLAQLAGVPCMGSVEAFRPCPSRTAITSRSGDRYRLLATKLGLFQAFGKPKTLLVVGAGGSSEAGAVASGLAAVVAAAGVRVTLIDADLDRRHITTSFYADALPGYADLLTKGGDLADVLVPVDQNFSLVPAGAGDPSSAPAVVAPLLARLKASGAELVIVAVPPVSRSSASVQWTGAVDVCLLVARRGATRAAAVTSVAQALSRPRGPLAGTALVTGHKTLRGDLVAGPAQSAASKAAQEGRPHETEHDRP